jgi:methylenetetrahydrofolate dehydrogenase (NADP+)/methenyltetrahydrofolate cyclohydrolase
MNLRLDGKIAAAAIKEELKEKIVSLPSKICLGIIRFDDPASESYLKGRLKIANELGVDVKVFVVEDNKTNEDLLTLVNTLNNDPSIHGIMIDRPLPRKYNEFEILSSINPIKDVDGYTPINLGKLVSNKQSYVSCTPGAAVRLVDYYNIDLTGLNALVIGRSVNVGKPLALLLLNKNATVTVAHSKTQNLKELCKKADIIFLALGKANFLNKEDINENTIIVDIGINFVDGKLCGDANKQCYDIAKAYSPVPGGVGVMTNVILMENLLQAYKNQNN